MRVEFHPDAANEFIETVEFYARERVNLGIRFRDAVLQVISHVSEFPDSGRRSSNSRKVSVPGFPYDVVYRIQNDELQVIALAHHRRRPGYWTSR